MPYETISLCVHKMGKVERQLDRLTAAIEDVLSLLEDERQDVQQRPRAG